MITHLVALKWRAVTVVPTLSCSVMNAAPRAGEEEAAPRQGPPSVRAPSTSDVISAGVRNRAASGWKPAPV